MPALLASPQVRALYEAEVQAVNKGLAHYEQISAWELLPADFTLETGELTPTQKVKRRVVYKKYADVVDRLYERAESGRAGTGA